MKTTYIRREFENYWQEHYYFKVVEVSPEVTKVVGIIGSDLNIDEHEEYNEAVSFVVNKLCNNRFSIIDRKTFDTKYKEYVSQLNELASY